MLQAQFATDKKSMERVYIAIVAGGFAKNNTGGTIDAPIGRHPKHGTKRCVRSETDASQSKKQNIKSAVTHWKVFFFVVVVVLKGVSKGARGVSACGSG